MADTGQRMPPAVTPIPQDRGYAPDYPHAPVLNYAANAPKPMPRVMRSPASAPTLPPTPHDLIGSIVNSLLAAQDAQNAFQAGQGQIVAGMARGLAQDAGAIGQAGSAAVTGFPAYTRQDTQAMGHGVEAASHYVPGAGIARGFQAALAPDAQTRPLDEYLADTLGSAAMDPALMALFGPEDRAFQEILQNNPNATDAELGRVWDESVRSGMVRHEEVPGLVQRYLAPAFGEPPRPPATAPDAGGTGGGQLPSGKLREIDDSAARVVLWPPARGKQRLGDVLDHPELFSVYPELRDFPIEIGQAYDSERGAGFAGLAYPDRLVVDPRFYSDPQSFGRTLIHELQHHLDRIEGRAMGSRTPDWLRRNARFNKVQATPESAYRRLETEQTAHAAEDRAHLRPDERAATAPFSEPPLHLRKHSFLRRLGNVFSGDERNFDLIEGAPWQVDRPTPASPAEGSASPALPTAPSIRHPMEMSFDPEADPMMNLGGIPRARGVLQSHGIPGQHAPRSLGFGEPGLPPNVAKASNAQRASAGGAPRFAAAIRDPQTGKIFTGANHGEALNNALMIAEQSGMSEPALSALSDRLANESGGFVRGSDGAYLSREDAMRDMAPNASGDQARVNAVPQQNGGATRTNRGVGSERGNEAFRDPRLTDQQNKAIELLRNGFPRPAVADELDIGREQLRVVLAQARKRAPDLEIPEGAPRTPEQENRVAQLFSQYKAEGRSNINALIADRLGMNPKTVSQHIYNARVRGTLPRARGNSISFDPADDPMFQGIDLSFAPESFEEAFPRLAMPSIPAAVPEQAWRNEIFGRRPTRQQLALSRVAESTQTRAKELPQLQRGILDTASRYGLETTRDPGRIALATAGLAGPVAYGTAAAIDQGYYAPQRAERAQELGRAEALANADRQDTEALRLAQPDSRANAPRLPPSPGPQADFSRAELQAAEQEIRSIMAANGALDRAIITPADIRRQAEIRRYGLRHGPGEPLSAPTATH